MQTHTPSLRALSLLGATLLIAHCGKSGGAAGMDSSGTYASVGSDPITIELKSGGSAVLSAVSLGSSTGTYAIDGEKIVITMSGQAHTFIKDGVCIENQDYGKLCKGGAAGAASNVTTRAVPVAPTGTWSATNSDGQFLLEFTSAKTLRFTATQPGGKPDIREGTFTVTGDIVQATIGQGDPLTLKFVNNAYESTSFGPLMRFVKEP